MVLRAAKRVLEVLAVALAVVLAVGCGGGSGGGSSGDRDLAPEPQITSPAAGATFKAGDTLSFVGGATDREDGELSPARLSWRVEHHRDGVVQDVASDEGVAGGQFTVPLQGLGAADFFYRVSLRAVDSKGQATELVRDIHPLASDVTLQTQPEGLSLKIDGQIVATPHTFSGVVDAAFGLEAFEQVSKDRRYRFASWSDGGPEARAAEVAPTATAYTARFDDAGPAVNQPPTVKVVPPLQHDGTLPISITVQAQDPDAPEGAQMQVELFDDNVSVGTDSVAPYIFAWSPTRAGNHVLKARVVDALGAGAMSQPVGFHVSAAPVTLTVPVFAAVNTFTTIEVSTGKPEMIAKVQLFEGATAIGTDTTPPFVFDWMPTSLGNHSLRAEVTDTQGIVSGTSFLTVNVQTTLPTPPTLALVAPSVATTGTLYLLETSVAPADSSIAFLQLYDNQQLLHGGSSGGLEWKPNTLGEHRLKIRAFDALSRLIATSPEVVVNVVALPPPLPLPSASAQASLWAGRSGGQGRFDGAALQSRFNTPFAVVADGAGNRYVADSQNHLIRRIAPDGTTSTLAGRAGYSGHLNGAASVARFSRPSGLALDGNGHLLVADQTTSTIRKVRLSDGTVSTIAGGQNVGTHEGGDGQPARMNHPVAVAAYPGNRVLVLDRDNHTIRELVGEQHFVPFAGATGWAGDAEASVNRLAARFRRPNAMAVDPATGAVLVMDQGNCVLRIVDPSGDVRILAGGQGDCRSLDGGPGVSRVDPGSSQVGSVPDVGGIVALGDGRAIFGDRSGLREVNLADGMVRTLQATVVDPVTGLVRPWPAVFVNGLARDVDGSVLAVSALDHAVLRLQPSAASTVQANVVAGQLRGSGSPVLGAPILPPQDINPGANGSVLVTGRAGGVQRITAQGSVETVIDPDAEPMVRFIRVAEGPNGVLYTATEPAPNVGLVTPSLRGYVQGQLAFTLQGGGYRPASGVVVDSLGRAVYTDFKESNGGVSNVFRVTPEGVATRLTTLPGRLGAIAIAPDDDVLVLGDANGSVVNGISSVVYRISTPPQGTVVSVVAGEGLVNARGLAVDAAGSVHVALGDCTIVRLRPDGKRDLVVGKAEQCAFQAGQIADALLPIGRGEFEATGTTRGYQSLKFLDDHLLMKMDDGIVRIGPLSVVPTEALRKRRKAQQRR